MDKQNGNTLVEVVLVLAAIGIFAAILLPALVTARSTRLDPVMIDTPSGYVSRTVAQVDPHSRLSDRPVDESDETYRIKSD